MKGKTALVTGGSSGIGLAIGHALSRAGARVRLVGRNAERLERTVSDACAEWLTEDVTHAAEAARLSSEIRSRLNDEPDIIVNSAGAFEPAWRRPCCTRLASRRPWRCPT